MILRLDPKTLLFESQRDEAAQIALVVSAIAELGPSDAEAVGEHCHCTRQWASDWLNRAVALGRLERSGVRPVIYALPGQPAETTINVTNDTIIVNTNTAHRVVVDGEEVTGGVFMR
jgi:hypothetical protein